VRYPTPARWRIRPLYAHDGDTLFVECDRGDDDRSVWAVRLKDVWAPELAQPGGVECRDFVTEWLFRNSDGSEWPFQLETFRTPRSDVDLKTLSRMVGVVTAAFGANLNTAVQALITERGYGGGVGAP
jgi:endonuclease YncB( thermonuclease family)